MVVHCERQHNRYNSMQHHSSPRSEGTVIVPHSTGCRPGHCNLENDGMMKHKPCLHAAPIRIYLIQIQSTYGHGLPNPDWIRIAFTFTQYPEAS